jgi:hypothetical protein
MYRIPSDLDLSPVVGELTTQVRVGAFDLQFTFGTVNFLAQSPVQLLRGETIVSEWEGGRWPDRGFYDILNTTVSRCDIVSDRHIDIGFENGLTMRLADDSDQYECLQIRIDEQLWVI